MFFMKQKQSLPEADKALPGRPDAMAINNRHYVLKTPLLAPFPEECESAYFGMGCFWGAEKLFWSLPGVYTTAVGYGAGYTPNPTYEEVCSGLTAHNELVLVVFKPDEIRFDQLLKVFWESHNPTEGMRQGNDVPGLEAKLTAARTLPSLIGPVCVWRAGRLAAFSRDEFRSPEWAMMLICVPFVWVGRELN